MGKSKYYFGQNAPGQVLKLIPDKIVNKAIKQTGSNFATKKFTTHKYYPNTNLVLSGECKLNCVKDQKK